MFEHYKSIARQLMTSKSSCKSKTKRFPLQGPVTHILAKVTANILAESKSRKCTGSGGLLAKLRWKMQPGSEASWPGNRLQAGHGWRGEQEGSLWWRSRGRRWWLRAGGGLRGVRGVRLHHLRDQQDGRRAEEEEKVVQWEGTLRDAKAPSSWWSKTRLSRKLGSFGHSTTSLLLAEEYLWLDCMFISKYTIYQQFIFQCWNHIIKITTTSGCF